MNAAIFNNYGSNSLRAVVINETDNLEDFIGKLFKYCEKIIFDNYKLLSSSYDAECLHQFRISLRQFRSILVFFKDEMSIKEWKKAEKLYKRLIKPTSKTRDFDVIATEYISSAFANNINSNEFEDFYQCCASEQKKLHTITENIILSKNFTGILNNFHDWINNNCWKKEILKNYSLKGVHLRKFIYKKVKRRHKKILNAESLIYPSTQNDLHKLRVNTKELRYILDILGSNIKQGKKESKDLKKLQEILGKINDTYVAEKVIQNFPGGGYDLSKQYITDQAIHLRHKYLIQLKKYYIETIY